MARSVNSTTHPWGGGIDTLVATGECDYLWATDSLLTNIFSTTDTLITGPLLTDTTFYLTSLTGQMDSVAPLPPHVSVYSGNVRGYWFTAPMDFIIPGLYVPTDASTGSQNIAVLKFDSIVPLYPGLTDGYTEMGYWNNYTGPDTIPVCFAIDSGDVIGIYGNRIDDNSYASTPYMKMIGGVQVEFFR